MEQRADGSYTYLNEDGAIVLQKDGVTSIPAEIDHTLVDRKSWEEHYLPKLKFSEERFDSQSIAKFEKEAVTRDEPLVLFCKSLFGHIRNWMGVVGISYLYADDVELYDEIIGTVAELSYKITERLLKTGMQFDTAHFWEDICFKNGPLVSPSVFAEKVGPYYCKITKLLNLHGVDIVSLDCDGDIDTLAPIWLENGVNTMFPIEVGTWGGSIAKLREKLGRDVRGIGGMNKHVLCEDYAAVDREIERLKPLVAMGGYIPCPDHRLPPDTKWEVVQYYCEQMRKTFIR